MMNFVRSALVSLVLASPLVAFGSQRAVASEEGSAVSSADEVDASGVGGDESGRATDHRGIDRSGNRAYASQGATKETEKLSKEEKSEQEKTRAQLLERERRIDERMERRNAVIDRRIERSRERRRDLRGQGHVPSSREQQIRELREMREERRERRLDQRGSDK